jgi:hypothetical protein
VKEAERHYLMIGEEFQYFYFDIIFFLLKFTVAAFPIPFAYTAIQTLILGYIHYGDDTSYFPIILLH